MLHIRMISAYSKERRYVAEHISQSSSSLAICLAARAGIENKLQWTLGLFFKVCLVFFWSVFSFLFFFLRLHILEFKILNFSMVFSPFSYKLNDCKGTYETEGNQTHGLKWMWDIRNIVRTRENPTVLPISFSSALKCDGMGKSPFTGKHKNYYKKLSTWFVNMLKINLLWYLYTKLLFILIFQELW